MKNDILFTKKCSVVILAAGRSQRMGFPKFSLAFNEKYSFLEEILQQYTAFGCREIILVLNDEGVTFVNKNLSILRKKVQIVVNKHLEWERFYSIKLGVQNLKFEYPVFIHNADNPYVNTEVLKKLLTLHSLFDFAVPVYQGHGGHPILLSTKVIHDISFEQKNDLIFSNFLKKYNKKTMRVKDDKILVNINTKSAYLKFLEKKK